MTRRPSGGGLTSKITCCFGRKRGGESACERLDLGAMMATPGFWDRDYKYAAVNWLCAHNMMSFIYVRKVCP